MAIALFSGAIVLANPPSGTITNLVPAGSNIILSGLYFDFSQVQATAGAGVNSIFQDTSGSEIIRANNVVAAGTTNNIAIFTFPFSDPIVIPRGLGLQLDLVYGGGPVTSYIAVVGLYGLKIS